MFINLILIYIFINFKLLNHYFLIDSHVGKKSIYKSILRIIVFDHFLFLIKRLLNAYTVNKTQKARKQQETSAKPDNK